MSWGRPFIVTLPTPSGAFDTSAERAQLSYQYAAGVAAPPPPPPPPPSPPTAGIVPVRYIVGTIPNVVPVETITVFAPGAVYVKEQVGPANVMPVRETSTEKPRVKVIKT